MVEGVSSLDNSDSVLFKYISEGDVSKVKDYFRKHVLADVNSSQQTILKYLLHSIQYGNENTSKYISENIHRIQDRSLLLKTIDLALHRKYEKVVLRLIRHSQSIVVTPKEFLRAIVIALRNDSFLSAQTMLEHYMKHSDGMELLSKLMTYTIKNQDLDLSVKLLSLGVKINSKNLDELIDLLDNTNYQLEEVTDKSLKSVFKSFKKDLQTKLPNNCVDFDYLEIKLNNYIKNNIRKNLDNFILLYRFKQATNSIVRFNAPQKPNSQYSSPLDIYMEKNIPQTTFEDLDRVLAKIHRQVGNVIQNKSQYSSSVL
jgi:hypothetical protein